MNLDKESKFRIFFFFFFLEGGGGGRIQLSCGDVDIDRMIIKINKIIQI